MRHRCHAAGCQRPCSAKMLMCHPCWSKVPADLQHEVYRTVRLRDKRSIDETWAPWWRAQAHAIMSVAVVTFPSQVDSLADVLKRELAFADSLEDVGLTTLHDT